MIYPNGREGQILAIWDQTWSGTGRIAVRSSCRSQSVGYVSGECPLAMGVSLL
jgi:hypothetical protein